MTQDLHLLTATEAARRIADGTLSAPAYTEALLQRIAETEPAVMAFETLDADGWRRAAESPRPGPMSGVPFVAKDIIDSVGLPTRFGSPIHRGNVPGTDAACIAALKAAGGILAGKAVTTEFANVTPGKTRNPHDPNRTPGGSSSGSAAAVAAGMVPVALGTQTTSSTIRPAAYCGVWGYVPSIGELPLWGVRQSSSTLDRLGLFARAPEDILLLRRLLQGREPAPLTPAGDRLRIGVCRTDLWDHVEPTAQTVFETTASHLAGSGHRVSDVTLPAPIRDLQAPHSVISSWEFVRNYTHEIIHHADQISDRLRNGRIAHGLACTWEQYRDALDLTATAQANYRDFMADFDLLVTPAAAGEAPDSATTGNFAFCAGWTLLGAPAISYPSGKGPAGLPLAIQLVGTPQFDERLLRCAATVARDLQARARPT